VSFKHCIIQSETLTSFTNVLVISANWVLPSST